MLYDSIAVDWAMCASSCKRLKRRANREKIEQFLRDEGPLSEIITVISVDERISKWICTARGSH